MSGSHRKGERNYGDTHPNVFKADGEDTNNFEVRKKLKSDDNTAMESSKSTAIPIPPTGSHPNHQQQNETGRGMREPLLESDVKEVPFPRLRFSLDDSSSDSEEIQSKIVFSLDQSVSDEDSESDKQMPLIEQEGPVISNKSGQKQSNEECNKCIFSINDSFTESEFDSSEDDDPIEPFFNIKREDTKQIDWYGTPGNTLEMTLNKASKIPNTCALNCLEKCHEKVTKEKKEEINDKILKETKSETKQALLDYLKGQDIFDLDTTKYHIGTTPVCITFLSSFTNISEYILKKVLLDFKNGVQQYVHFKQSDKQDSLKTLNFISWFENYFELVGDKSPTDNRIDLPSYLTKIAIYNEYKENVTEGEAISESQFYYLLKYRYGSKREDKRIPHIRIPKQNTHTQCTACLSLKNFRQSAKTEIDKDLAESMLKTHHALHREERRLMKVGMQKCIDYPDDNAGFLIDKMDNNKTMCPKTRSAWKQCASMQKLKSHVTGVIIQSSKYSLNRKIKMIVNLDQFEQGSSLTVTILHKSILDYVADHGSLPPNLHLCLDNCYRENKNKYLFAYLFGLVKLGIVKEVFVYFLQVGHTHDAVDQLFSRIDKWITKKEVSTLDQLINLIQTAPMNPKAEVEILWNISDFKGFISPLLAQPFLQNHSNLHGFNIKKEQGQTRFRGKPLLGDNLYGPATGINLLKDDANLHGVFPAASFRLEEMNLQKLKQDIKNLYLPTLLPEKRTRVELSWDELIDKLESLTSDGNLDVLSYDQLPKYTTPEASHSYASEVEKTIHKDPPALVGDIIPETPTSGAISEATIGADVVVYTRIKKGRPWVGRIENVDHTSRKISLNWYKRNVGRSNTWTSMKNENGSKLVQDLEFEVAMFYGFTIHRTEETFDITPQWLKIIQESYNHHDQNFE